MAVTLTADGWKFSNGAEDHGRSNRPDAPYPVAARGVANNAMYYYSITNSHSTQQVYTPMYAGNCYLIPFWGGSMGTSGCKISNFRWYVATAGSSVNAHFALYNSDARGYPSTLICHGETTQSSTGYYEQGMYAPGTTSGNNLQPVLEHKWYWAAMMWLSPYHRTGVNSSYTMPEIRSTYFGGNNQTSYAGLYGFQSDTSLSTLDLDMESGYFKRAIMFTFNAFGVNSNDLNSHFRPDLTSYSGSPGGPTPGGLMYDVMSNASAAYYIPMVELRLTDNI